MIFGTKEKNKYYLEREGVYGVFTKNGKIGVVKVDNAHFLVGGGIEKSENLLACMYREFQEEIGYSVKAISFLEKYTEYHRSENDQRYYKLIGNVFKVELDKKIAEPVEKDHELVWLEFDEVKEKMELEYQAHAIETIMNHTKA